MLASLEKQWGEKKSALCRWTWDIGWGENIFGTASVHLSHKRKAVRDGILVK